MNLEHPFIPGAGDMTQKMTETMLSEAYLVRLK
jgi:hypothetical protein